VIYKKRKVQFFDAHARNEEKREGSAVDRDKKKRIILKYSFQTKREYSRESPRQGNANLQDCSVWGKMSEKREAPVNKEGI